VSKPPKSPQRREADELRAEGFPVRSMDVLKFPGRPTFDPTSDAPIVAGVRDPQQFIRDVAALARTDAATRRFVAEHGHLGSVRSPAFLAALSAWVRERLTSGFDAPSSVEWQQRASSNLDRFWQKVYS